MSDCELCGFEPIEHFSVETDFGEKHVCDTCYVSLTDLPTETRAEKTARIKAEINHPSWEEKEGARLGWAMINFLIMLGHDVSEFISMPKKAR